MKIDTPFALAKWYCYLPCLWGDPFYRTILNIGNVSNSLKKKIPSWPKSLTLSVVVLKTLCGLLKTLLYKLPYSFLSKSLCSSSHLDKWGIENLARSGNSAQGHMASLWHDCCSNTLYVMPCIFAQWCFIKNQTKQTNQTQQQKQ